MTVDEVLARQAGVISLGQAAAAGLSRTAVHRRAAAGVWRRLYPGVLLAGGHRLTDEARVRAAWLSAGPAAVVTGQAAAWWHRTVERCPDRVDVTVPRRLHLSPRRGVELHRRDLHREDAAWVRDLRVAAIPLAVLETAAALTDGSTFLDRALQRHVPFPAVYRCYCRGMGRHGWTEATRLLGAAAQRADSAAERLLVDHLRAAGLEGWVTGHPFGTWRIDVAFPRSRVAVEVDGWAWHVDAERFRNDRREGNALTRAGWLLLRFTWHDLDGRPGGVVAEIRDALALAAA